MKFYRGAIRVSWLVTLIVGATVLSGIRISHGNSNLALVPSVTVATDSLQYILREKVTVMGNVSLDGLPASDMLISIEIKDPIQRNLFYKTLPIGDPNESWVLEIVDVYVLDLAFNPLDTVKIGNTIWIGATVKNTMPTTRDPVVVTLTIIDGNQIIIDAFQIFAGSIPPNGNITAYKTVNIPTWSYSGKAFIFVNVFNKIPSQDGVPYIPELSAEFYTSYTSQGVFGGLPLVTQIHNSSSTIGAYETVFRLSPAPEPGEYVIYAAGRYDPVLRATNTTTFQVTDVEAPPQASFYFSPLDPYPNETVTFDGSASSAEGYGDVIIQYEWDFGDGTPKVVKSGDPTNPPDPTVTHNFMATGQYIVTLNVTDTEGLWGIAQKPLTTQPTDPTANFTWDPSTPRINRTVSFNATTSLPGWSIPNAAPAPISSYVWNFGDSPVNYTVTDPYLTHVYTDPGNWTVTLTVVDSESQQDTTNRIISVANTTSPPYDVNGDGIIDIMDIAIVAIAYGSYPGDPNWNPIADINGDGQIDIMDIAMVAIHYGETV